MLTAQAIQPNPSVKDRNNQVASKHKKGRCRPFRDRHFRQEIPRAMPGQGSRAPASGGRLASEVENEIQGRWPRANCLGRCHAWASSALVCACIPGVHSRTSNARAMCPKHFVHPTREGHTIPSYVIPRPVRHQRSRASCWLSKHAFPLLLRASC
eukprot:353830-Chlamydomonas_euryale.AAC.9